MPITANNPFKGRQYPGEVIVLCVRWYLRYPPSYEHVSELLSERGVEVDPSFIWRWVQVYAPELNKRCRLYLKPTNKSYRIPSIAAVRVPLHEHTTDFNESLATHYMAREIAVVLGRG